jgi:5,10-methylenetetrahydromethanopterin reductase
VVVICHPDIEAMREVAIGMVAPFARFQVIQGEAAGPQSDSDARNLAANRHAYDMTKHDHILRHDKLKGASLSHDFAECFAIIGPPERCIERLLQLNALGIERFVIVGPGFHPEASADGPSLFAREVMPAVRAASREW